MGSASLQMPRSCRYPTIQPQSRSTAMGRAPMVLGLSTMTRTCPCPRTSPEPLARSAPHRGSSLSYSLSHFWVEYRGVVFGFAELKAEEDVNELFLWHVGFYNLRVRSRSGRWCHDSRCEHPTLQRDLYHCSSCALINCLRTSWRPVATIPDHVRLERRYTTPKPVTIPIIGDPHKVTACSKTTFPTL